MENAHGCKRIKFLYYLLICHLLCKSLHAPLITQIQSQSFSDQVMLDSTYFCLYTLEMALNIYNLSNVDLQSFLSSFYFLSHWD